VLGKPAFNDIKEGIVTAPLVYGLLDTYRQGKTDKFTAFNSIVCSSFANKEHDVPLGVSLLFESSGLEMADKLSIDYINQAVCDLKSTVHAENKAAAIDMTRSEHARALVGLVLKVKTRTF